MMPDRDSESSAEGAAYTADAMHFRIPMPLHEANSTPFYFKHCNENGEQAYYSKTEYDCSYP